MSKTEETTGPEGAEEEAAWAAYWERNWGWLERAKIVTGATPPTFRQVFGSGYRAALATLPPPAGGHGELIAAAEDWIAAHDCGHPSAEGIIRRLASALAAQEAALEGRRPATEAVAHWMIEHGYATGHGDTVEDMLGELEWQAVERGGRQSGAIDDDRG